jgi:hypothetical protein
MSAFAIAPIVFACVFVSAPFAAPPRAVLHWPPIDPRLPTASILW